MKRRTLRKAPRSTAGQFERRQFVNLMAASLGLAGLGSCTRQPEEKILPYARFPEPVTPGEPLYFATAMTLGGYAKGLLVKSYNGRPVKIEGNARHPSSLGATDIFAQASIFALYDPHRAQFVTQAGRLSRWMLFITSLNQALQAQRRSDGAGIRVLTQTVTSPTLAWQLEQLLDRFPAARWHQFEPAGTDTVREGARLAFDRDVNTIYRFDRADVVLALDADFLCEGPGCLRYAHDFMTRRHPEAGGSDMNRLYVVEPVPSNTGAVADHRLCLRTGQIQALTLALAVDLKVLSVSSQPGALPSHAREWVAAVARDLDRRRGSSVVIAGAYQPPVVHLLAHAINSKLGNVGHTVLHTDPVEALPVNQLNSLKELVRDMDAGRVELLVILGGNPAFDAPVDFDFPKALSRVKFRVHSSLYRNETSRLCHWHIPEAHYLESWSDARAHNGSASVVQPLIAPLYEGKSAHQIVAALMGRPDASGYDLLRDYWRGRAYSLFLRSGRSMASEEDFELFWQSALHEGFIPDTEADLVSVAVRPDLARALEREPKLSPPAALDAKAGSLEIIFRPDPTVWDGAFTDNPWLQELPKPLTKLTWDNTALLSPTTAHRLALRNGDVVELRLGSRTVEAPVWIMPGHADEALSVTIGYGRTRGSLFARAAGFDAYRIRESNALWSLTGLEIRKTGKRRPLASTQHHLTMEDRQLVRAANVADFLHNPQLFRQAQPETIAIYPAYEYKDYAWGMAVDLNLCTGCNACVLACSSENNIPVVGKQEVLRGRQMHWIRVDRYFEGDLDNPAIHAQPVACMNCEMAPCEVVCPVGATVHSSEGLNEMIYNRCVGSRYCVNNCPYKVRRFNFLHYTGDSPESLKGQRNPNVTVRTRGVMEKCSYCVQRISAARIEAKKENRQIRDGKVVTACQASCPTGAIVFGNINDPDSQVSQVKAQPQNYGILTELGTRPRTSYLAKLTNPNPELAPNETTAGHDEE
jgi:Fe-S-cluster-containing dehydrogenase component